MEVKLPISSDLMRVETLIERTCQSRRPTMKVKTSLRSYQGSTHWHFKKGIESGTLEITFWKQGRRLWLSVHANRTGVWTTKELEELKSVLEQELEGPSNS